ncbi:conserved hypothetical protein [Ricinus communis]|uniref:Uncharacterized protein n=1 Tax=Ricinus communis TaxID=3988 RepID=B9SNW5_RICCO|nr:conserved hypothetical protein [Ricinus communis]
MANKVFSKELIPENSKGVQQHRITHHAHVGSITDADISVQNPWQTAVESPPWGREQSSPSAAAAARLDFQQSLGRGNP